MEFREVPHSASLRKCRVSLPNHAYFVTKCLQDASIGNLASPSLADIIVSSLDWARNQNWWRLLGLVIMLDHYHIIVGLGSLKSLEQVMASIDKFTARQINQVLG